MYIKSYDILDFVEIKNYLKQRNDWISQYALFLISFQELRWKAIKLLKHITNIS